jgi:REP element-mobilizing transposase RayT
MHWRKRLMRRQAMNEPGLAHELTFTCFHSYPFLSAERTCQWLADEVNEARRVLGFQVWAYVFMPEHVHLLVHPNRPDYEMAAVLKAIKEPVGRKAIKYLRCGAVWCRGRKIGGGQARAGSRAKTPSSRMWRTSAA